MASSSPPRYRYTFLLAVTLIVVAFLFEFDNLTRSERPTTNISSSGIIPGASSSSNKREVSWHDNMGAAMERLSKLEQLLEEQQEQNSALLKRIEKFEKDDEEEEEKNSIIANKNNKTKIDEQDSDENQKQSSALKQTLTNQTIAPSTRQKSCRDIMNYPHSPWREGDFLTRRTLPISWIPRMDGSRDLQHSLCDLHRFTATEARQCLQGQHWYLPSRNRNFFLSLATFLHTGQYPARFGVSDDDCHHIDEMGKLHCSEKPNICIESYWWNRNNKEGEEKKWRSYMRNIRKMFNGSMEVHAMMMRDNNDTTVVETYLYESPPFKNSAKRFRLSYTNEETIGGWNSTGCTAHGKCRVTHFYNQNNTAFFEKDASRNVHIDLLQKQVSPINTMIYNLDIDSDDKWMDNVTQQIYSTLGGQCVVMGDEFSSKTKRIFAQQVADEAGCVYFDLQYILQDFHAAHSLEATFIFVPKDSFLPWVYEEVNNLLLNMLCNIVKKKDD